MKTAILLFVFLTGCAATRELPNGCLVDAISHQNAVDSEAKLSGGKVWNKVLFVTGGAYGTGKPGSPGHCYSVFLWPPGANTLWAYDARGSQRVRAFTKDPAMIARKVLPPAGNGFFLE